MTSLVHPDNKIQYTKYHDEIMVKRFLSPFPLRRYAHERQYQEVLRFVRPGMKVLDSGCGEGVFAMLAARKGATVTGCDLSMPNIEAARQYAAADGLVVNFMQGDAEALPFRDGSFDLVISSHVLEHLPDFNQGLRELARVTRTYAVVALPTCMNLASLAQCGGGNFWTHQVRDIVALPIGLVRWFLNLGGEGIDGGYAGKEEFHHIWRYPWAVRARIAKSLFTIEEVRASTLMLPWFSGMLPLVRVLDRCVGAPLLRWCGYSTTLYLRRRDSQ